LTTQLIASHLNTRIQPRDQQALGGNFLVALRNYLKSKRIVFKIQILPTITT
jgi:hypothetical protein